MKVEEIFIISTSKVIVRQHFVANGPHQYAALGHRCNFFGNGPLKHGVFPII